MRRFVPILSSSWLALPAAAWAIPPASSPGDGTLVVDNGRGQVIVKARGGIIGRFDSGRLISTTSIESDGAGADRLRRRAHPRPRQRAPHAVRGRGRPLPHDRRPLPRPDPGGRDGRQRSRARHGAVLDASGFTDLPGRYSIDGGPFQPLPGQPTPTRSASRRPVRPGSEPAEHRQPDRTGRRGRELDRVLRRALPQERRATPCAPRRPAARRSRSSRPRRRR